jgi:phosphoglycolate phosphatase
MSVRLAVFDCDGTIVDGQGAICESMEHAFAHVGLPAPDRHQIRHMVGLSLPQAIRLLAPDADDAAQTGALEAYKTRFAAMREQGLLAETIFAGMADAMRALHADGWLLGVATGKSTRGLDATIAQNALGDLFCTLQTADGHPSKPHPAMLEAAIFEAGAQAQRTVVIGDTQYDIAMAQGAGAKSIGVEWGYHLPADLRAAGADAIAASPADLPGLCNDLIHA